MLAQSRATAKRKGLPHTITIDDIVVPQFCPVFGLKLERGNGKPHDNSPSIDKIIPELGYIPGNVIVVSWRANNLKKDASVTELIQLAAFYATRGAPCN